MAADRSLALAGAALGLVLLAAQWTDATAQGERVYSLTDTLVGGVGGVAVDRAGRIYVADFAETVWKVTPDGRASVFATGFYGASGNAIDSRGNLFQSNFYGQYISKVDRFGNHETFADSGFAGPATGEHHRRLVAQFESLIEELLAERPVP